MRETLCSVILSTAAFAYGQAVSMDPAFRPILDNGVLSIALQGDGKILLGGSFRHVNGAVCDRIARLNADGTLDRTFSGSANGLVRSVAPDSNGRVLVRGEFNYINGEERPYLARLNSDGSIDPAFTGWNQRQQHVFCDQQSDGEQPVLSVG